MVATTSPGKKVGLSFIHPWNSAIPKEGFANVRKKNFGGKYWVDVHIGGRVRERRG
jgi:hypothetical protein